MDEKEFEEFVRHNPEEALRLVLKALSPRDLLRMGNRSFVDAIKYPESRLDLKELVPDGGGLRVLVPSAPDILQPLRDPLKLFTDFAVVPASYVVFQDEAGRVYAKNGRTGEIDFSGADAVAVLQRAIDALTGGGEIFVKAGLYIISKTLVIKSYITLRGEGRASILKAADGLNDRMLENEASAVGSGTNNRIKICDLVFDGNKANQTSTAGSRSDYSPLHFLGLWESVIESVEIKNTYGGAAIELWSGGKNIVRNCYIHDNGSSAWPCDAIFTSDVDDVLVGNILVNNNDTGIAIDSGSRITAVGNYLEGNARGVYAKASAAHCGHIVIVGNVFLNNNINILLERTASYELNEVTVVGNKIVGGTYGVEVNALRVIVSNNADSDHGAGGVGIRLTGGNEIQVLGNIFTNSGKGIELAGADAVWIKHNRFIAVTTPIAFTVSPGTFMIRDNVGYDTGNFKATGVGVAVGTGGAYGSAVAITSPSGRITYPRIKITWGGTFGTGETVTVRVEAVYSDGSTAYVERSATAVGSAWLTDDDVLALIAQGKDIIKLNVYAKSNMSTTSVTVTVDAYGKA